MDEIYVLGNDRRPSRSRPSLLRLRLRDPHLVPGLLICLRVSSYGSAPATTAVASKIVLISMAHFLGGFG